MIVSFIPFINFSSSDLRKMFLILLYPYNPLSGLNFFLIINDISREPFTNLWTIFIFYTKILSLSLNNFYLHFFIYLFLFANYFIHNFIAIQLKITLISCFYKLFRRLERNSAWNRGWITWINIDLSRLIYSPKDICSNPLVYVFTSIGVQSHFIMKCIVLQGDLVSISLFK